MHIKQHAHLRCSIGARRLNHIGWHLADAQIGKPYQRRQSEHHRHHRGRHLADAPEKDEGQHVDEGVHHLHGVQHRTHAVPDAVKSAAKHPYGNADYHAQQHGHDDETDSSRSFYPVGVPQDAANEQSYPYENPDLDVAHQNGDGHKNQHHPKPRDFDQKIFYEQVDEFLERPFDHIQHSLHLIVHPEDDLLSPVAERNAPLVQELVIQDARGAFRIIRSLGEKSGGKPAHRYSSRSNPSMSCSTSPILSMIMRG